MQFNTQTPHEVRDFCRTQLQGDAARATGPSTAREQGSAGDRVGRSRHTRTTGHARHRRRSGTSYPAAARHSRIRPPHSVRMGSAATVIGSCRVTAGSPRAGTTTRRTARPSRLAVPSLPPDGLRPPREHRPRVLGRAPLLLWHVRTSLARERPSQSAVDSPAARSIKRSFAPVGVKDRRFARRRSMRAAVRCCGKAIVLHASTP